MKLRIGTRGSKLALAQVDEVKRELDSTGCDCQIEVKVIQTLGDSKQGTEEALIRDKQDWIQGLDTALMNDEVDLAVHSAKDVPVDISPLSMLIPFGKRLSPYDVFIPREGSGLKFNSLPNAAQLGTASLRRRAQLLSYRSDLQVISHRGNINTRIEKLNAADSELDGIILAAAGLERIDYPKEKYELINIDDIVPAVNQGILAIHCLKDRMDIIDLFMSFTNQTTCAAFEAERLCVKLLEANCHSAIGTYAKIEEDLVKLQCRVLSPMADRKIEAYAESSINHPREAGRQVAEDLIVQGASAILHESTQMRAGWEVN